MTFWTAIPQIIAHLLAPFVLWLRPKIRHLLGRRDLHNTVQAMSFWLSDI